jgi:hypothetical protein
MDNSFSKYVGWEESLPQSIEYRRYFSKNTVHQISRDVTALLRTALPDMGPIQVTDRVIENVMAAQWDARTPVTGDPHSRYTIDSCRDDVGVLIQAVTALIVDHVATEYQMEECNRGMSVWNTVYGDCNEAGLRPTAKIYTREKRPQQMMFNMNY